jgi:hypothetical protein
VKPEDTTANSPLIAHPHGQFCKTIRGKRHDFGTDPDEALAKYYRQKDDLQAGRQPAFEGDVNLEDLVNHFCANAKARTGEPSPLSLRDDIWTGEQMVARPGRTADPT